MGSSLNSHMQRPSHIVALVAIKNGISIYNDILYLIENDFHVSED